MTWKTKTASYHTIRNWNLWKGAVTVLKRDLYAPPCPVQKSYVEPNLIDRPINFLLTVLTHLLIEKSCWVSWCGGTHEREISTDLKPHTANPRSHFEGNFIFICGLFLNYVRAFKISVTYYFGNQNRYIPVFNQPL